MQHLVFIGIFHFKLVILLFSIICIFTLPAQNGHESKPRPAFASHSSYSFYPRKNYSRNVSLGSVTHSHTDHNPHLQFIRKQGENGPATVSSSEYKNGFNQMESWEVARQGVISVPFSTIGENAGLMKEFSQTVENSANYEISMPFKITEQETQQSYWHTPAHIVSHEYGKQTKEFHSVGHSTDAMHENAKNDKIVFLDDRYMPITTKDRVDFIPRVGNEGPSCANGTTFCEEPDYYPKQFISDIFRKKISISLYKNLFNYDPKYEEKIEILNRLDREEELCRYHERIVFPKMGRTVNDKWKFIANTEEVRQGFRVEICDNPDGPCTFADSFPLGYRVKCKQKYITRKLWSLSDGGETSEEYFYFPSCCTCLVRHMGDVDDYV